MVAPKKTRATVLQARARILQARAKQTQAVESEIFLFIPRAFILQALNKLFFYL